MTSKNEQAGVWVRVSTADQTEANQVPDIERHCAAHGYTIARRYELNDKSASKGAQQSYQDQVFEDIRNGEFRVLVAWATDRVERRGPEALFGFIRKIKDAGGRIEFIKDPLAGTEDMSGEAVTALAAVIDHQESVRRSERQRISVEAAKSRGALYSVIPWAMATEGAKGHKQIVPTDLCRAVVPQIFDRCIEGMSLAQIAAWLDSEGIPTRRGTERWSESTVRWIIRQQAYAGRWVNRKGETIQRCEAVVSPSTFDRAQAALKNREKKGPNSKVPPLLAKVKCNRCGSPMYRVRSGNPGNKRYYYRCYGRMPQRHGCGQMVPLAQTDTIIITRVFMTSTEPYRTRQWVEGTNYDDEISDIKQTIREVADAERFEELPELQAKLAELRRKNEEEATAGHYEYTDTGITVGDYFDSLDLDGKREYLKTRDIRVEKVSNPPLEPGASVGIRVIIDGVDHGVYPYPPKMPATDKNNGN
jgi:DNA invertase Pin-like site-specific DNA recombinase